MKTKKCLICGSKDLSRSFKKNDYSFLKCDNCGLIFVHPLPDSKKLIADFYSLKSGYHSKLALNLAEANRHNKKFIKIINRITDLKTEGDLLDVGCSNGEFLFLAKKQGFKIHGVEVNEFTANIAVNNGLNVFRGTLEEARFEDNRFSVIHLGDVIEHVSDPAGLLKECRRILKNKGMLIISTPNIDCFWAKATKKIYEWFEFPWSILVPPYHLFIFSEFNFKRFLWKSNFSILNVEYGRCFLRHELGSTGLLKKFKTNRTARNLFYALTVFLIYATIFLVDFLATPFLKKNFDMLVFAQKL